MLTLIMLRDWNTITGIWLRLVIREAGYRDRERYKKRDTLCYTIFNDCFEIGIYIKKKVTIFVMWRFYIQNPDTSQKARQFVLTFIYKNAAPPEHGRTIHWNLSYHVLVSGDGAEAGTATIKAMVEASRFGYPRDKSG